MAASGGIVADLFVQVAEKGSVSDGTLFSMLFIVLVAGLLAARALQMALFAGDQGVGSMCLYGAVIFTGASILSLKFDPTIELGSTPVVFLCITGCLLLAALSAAIYRKDGFFRDVRAKNIHVGAVFGHGVGLAALIAMPCLLMNNVREALHDTGNANTTDYTNHGPAFFAMIGCAFVGLAWLSYIMFGKKWQDGTKFWSVIGSGFLLGAGTCLVLGFDGLGEIAKGTPDVDELKSIFSSENSQHAAPWLFIGAGGLLLAALTMRFMMWKCQAKK